MKKVKIFKCDGCGEIKPIKEKNKMVNENGKVQKGSFECNKCKWYEL